MANNTYLEKMLKKKQILIVDYLTPNNNSTQFCIFYLNSNIDKEFQTGYLGCTDWMPM